VCDKHFVFLCLHIPFSAVVWSGPSHGSSSWSPFLSPSSPVQFQAK